MFFVLIWIVCLVRTGFAVKLVCQRICPKFLVFVAFQLKKSLDALFSAFVEKSGPLTKAVMALV